MTAGAAHCYINPRRGMARGTVEGTAPRAEHLGNKGMKSRTLRRALLAGSIACVLQGAALATAVAGSAGPDAERIAREHLAAQATSLGLARADIAEAVLSSSHTTDHNGVSHVYLVQRYRGIEVWGGVFNTSILPDGRVLHSGNRFVADLARQGGRATPRISAQQALQRVASDTLSVAQLAPVRVLQRPSGQDQRTVLSDAGLAARPIEARLVWFPQADGGVRLAWELEIEEASGHDWWQAVVDASDGTTLEMHNLVIHESAEHIAAAIARPRDGSLGLVSQRHGHHYGHHHHDHHHGEVDGRGHEQALSPFGFEPTDGASYRVFAMPYESPDDGGRTLVTDVADPVASPLGWHDTGAVQYTVTRGNNVHAYADRSANNQPDPGSDPDGGPGLVFDFPLDLTRPPVESQAAIVTNLFYWNNIMHDVAYRYGFTEAAGNFQVNNFGRGGAGNDDVRAEAQDGGGTNNANFATPADGSRPRMQMYEWTYPFGTRLTVTTGAAAGVYYGTSAAFGPSLGSTPANGSFAAADDGSANPIEGCDPFTVPAGSIAIVQRGTCPFTQKVKNAQDGGASGVVVFNNVPGAPIAMGGADATITIPSMMIRLEQGQALVASLPAEGGIDDPGDAIPNRDSDLDAGVIAHEYGHGISNRLTGGRNVVNCLNNAEQMGEGWSDWFGIVLTANAADTRYTPRGVGSYLRWQGPGGAGIRPTPYATEMHINPSTYGSLLDTAGISQPHGIGYVWNTMLWEMYWNLVEKHGFNSDFYGAWDTGGNNLAQQLVMDGMAIQACRPGFVDGRDAILAADVALGGHNQCEIWRAFAKRGLGFSADQGDPNNRSDGVEAFDLPAACTRTDFVGFERPLRDGFRNRARAGAVVEFGFQVTGDTDSILVDAQPADCRTLRPIGGRPEVLASSEDGGIAVDGDVMRVQWQTRPEWSNTCHRVTVRVPGEADGHIGFWLL